MIQKVLGVVLDVGLATDLGIKGNDNQATPDAGIHSADARQMVRIQYQRMRRAELERVAVLFFGRDFICGAELLHDGSREPSPLFEFRGDQKPLPFDLGQFGTDIPLAADGEGICRNGAGIVSESSGNGVPEGGLAVGAVAIGNNQGLLINGSDGTETGNFLNILN